MAPKFHEISNTSTIVSIFAGIRYHHAIILPNSKITPSLGLKPAGIRSNLPQGALVFSFRLETLVFVFHKNLIPDWHVHVMYKYITQTAVSDVFSRFWHFSIWRFVIFGYLSRRNEKFIYFPFQLEFDFLFCCELGFKKCWKCFIFALGNESLVFTSYKREKDLAQFHNEIQKINVSKKIIIIIIKLIRRSSKVYEINSEFRDYPISGQI